MSSYMPAQALLKTLLLTMSSYFASTDVTEGDYRVLDNGGSAYAVLFPGAVIQYDTAGLTRSHVWECIIDLVGKFVDDTSYSTFGTLRDAVIAKLDTVKALSADYFITTVRSDGNINEIMSKSGGGPFFLSQYLVVTIEEQV